MYLNSCSESLCIFFFISDVKVLLASRKTISASLLVTEQLARNVTTCDV